MASGLVQAMHAYAIFSAGVRGLLPCLPAGHPCRTFVQGRLSFGVEAVAEAVRRIMFADTGLPVRTFVSPCLLRIAVFVAVTFSLCDRFA